MENHFSDLIVHHLNEYHQCPPWVTNRRTKICWKSPSVEGQAAISGPMTVVTSIADLMATHRDRPHSHQETFDHLWQEQSRRSLPAAARSGALIRPAQPSDRLHPCNLFAQNARMDLLWACGNLLCWLCNSYRWRLAMFTRAHSGISTATITAGRRLALLLIVPILVVGCDNVVIVNSTGGCISAPSAPTEVPTSDGDEEAATDKV